MSITWSDGTKSRETTHRLTFMAFHKILKAVMPSTDENGDKLEVSHLCHRGVCVKPAHLDLESHETIWKDAHVKCKDIAASFMSHSV